MGALDGDIPVVDIAAFAGDTKRLGRTPVDNVGSRPKPGCVGRLFTELRVGETTRPLHADDRPGECQITARRDASAPYTSRNSFFAKARLSRA